MPILFLLLVFYTTNIIASENKIKDPKTVYSISDNWCPYTCDEKSDRQGLLVELVRAIYAVSNLDIVYNNTSYPRAIQNVRNGDYDVLLGIDHYLQEELEITSEFWVNDETVFAVREEDNIFIDEASDLKKYRIGHISEYTYDDTDVWEPSIQNSLDGITITSSIGEPHLLILLQRNRIDLAVLNRDVANHYLKSTPEEEKIKLIFVGISAKLYIGFNKTERGLEFREKFRVGFNHLIKTDQLKDIYKKYKIIMPDFKISI